MALLARVRTGFMALHSCPIRCQLVLLLDNERTVWRTVSGTAVVIRDAPIREGMMDTLLRSPANPALFLACVRACSSPAAPVVVHLCSVRVSPFVADPPAPT